ncbi:phage antirepressor N-terminal domain-containing protein [Raoultella ornithinolytica]|uniref:phage antirepressor N-terminal domain-containing protein n=1 Tax=Raoultella ornithinolytica TaxID=54291 RepID=UPI001F2C28A1|nr:phage antirepressor N-terminal domain-containing protein [Raoultella ornithinolytica]MCF6660709.1 phage antirepressor N-terminal domain-containing protein [Raoultella ornithinolytica]HDV8763965.1 phage antirepressor N-terminal domain-containing protein [Raoultella ornithinolytica]
MTSLAIADRTINVPFYGNSLFVVEHNGEPYTPMKPIIDGMGMDWASQFTKLKQRFKTSIVKITMQLPGDNQRRDLICLALRKLAGWLQTISPNKVRPEIRDKVIQYQEECDDVLYEYWTKGEVKNPRKKTTVDERTPLRDAVNMLVSKRHMMYPEAYAMIHQRFNVDSIEDLDATQIPDAIEYVHRVALEGEFIGKQEALPAPALDIHYPAEWWDQFPFLQRDRKVQKSTVPGGYQFPVMLLYGFEGESPSAISSLISKLAMQGYDVSAVKMEYLAHRHYAERMYQKLSRIAEISGSVLGSSITLNIQAPIRA